MVQPQRVGNRHGERCEQRLVHLGRSRDLLIDQLSDDCQWVTALAVDQIVYQVPKPGARRFGSDGQAAGHTDQQPSRAVRAEN